ncbi:DUF2484 family protein [uncultured Roseobacter sp.]|uniref:DUF2484 family protein n=1 Tax=uncultured Roseobacter sp. TaxID=114847 RepID=UPI00260EA3E9|nr:DUF2484 family protein [uncultured Roseobacter sp.]
MVSPPLVLAVLWVVLANLRGARPIVDQRWHATLVLVVVGIPILGYVTWLHGPWVGLLVFAGGVSTLRWPLLRGRGR